VQKKSPPGFESGGRETRIAAGREELVTAESQSAIHAPCTLALGMVRLNQTVCKTHTVRALQTALALGQGRISFAIFGKLFHANLRMSPAKAAGLPFDNVTACIKQHG
jgi:hypothetical protein